MGETTREIEEHINRTREDLASNIRELEGKVKSVADWREHVNAHPAVALGVAFGGGLLLGSLVPGRAMHEFNGMMHAMAGPAASADDHPYEFAHPRPPSAHQEKAREAWDVMKGALLGIAISRLTQVLDEVLPGFKDEVQRVQGERKQAF